MQSLFRALRCGQQATIPQRLSYTSARSYRNHIKALPVPWTRRIASVSSQHRKVSLHTHILSVPTTRHNAGLATPSPDVAPTQLQEYAPPTTGILAYLPKSVVPY